MRHLFWMVWLCAPLSAHVLSMSTGDVRLDGRRAVYELRMPLYEIAHVASPERTLLDSIGFSSGGVRARRVEGACRSEDAQGQYICSAVYEFPEPVERLDVECTFHSVTVPNHVHLLRAARADKRDQAVLDFSFPKAEIRFEPPTSTEIALQQTAAGMWRAMGGAAQVLFLASLVLAARSRKELTALAAMFLCGQTISALVVRMTAWQPAPRFVEAAMALTIAYLAVEVLLLPQAGSRWLVAGGLGAFHGLYFDLFLRTTDFSPGFVLAGAALADVLLIAAFGFVFRKVGRFATALRPVQVAASLLLATGLIWFALRMRG